MTAFDRPLVALSLTEADESLLAYAASRARSLEWNDILFAHVSPDEPAPWGTRLRDAVERVFAAPKHARGHAFHAVQGARLDQILGLAVEHRRDLIVLGHRRIRSGRRSLARRLAMVAPASVWLVPEGAAPAVNNILVPIDFSQPSADALAVAISVARAHGLDRLRAAHVFFDPSTIRYDEHVTEIVGQEEAAFDQFVAGIDTSGIQVEPVFVEGTRTARDILDLAARSPTDLIVMSTRGRSHAAGVLLGSVTSDTLAATSIPLLAVKHFGSRLTLREALVNHRIWEQPSPKTN
jgi:nucleotide-binding universal stress UspA family protein